MYEQFKHDLMSQLSANAAFTNEQISQVMFHLDVVSGQYEITRKETAVTVFNQELPSAVKNYIVCKSIEGFSEGTLYNYTRCLKNFFFAVQKAPEEVTPNDVRMYLYQYKQARQISDRSLDKIRVTLSGFYSWMVAEGYTERNPLLTVNCIKFEKKPRTACSQRDLEYLRMACKTTKQKAIIEVLYSTGCRVGELVNLKKNDIDWKEGTIHLFGKGKKHRTGYLNAKAEIALKEYLKTRDDDKEWLFVSDRRPHNQMHNCGVQKIIREIAERAGENVQVKVTPHVMRHTTATVMLANNADLPTIQAVLGHSNINTTMIYAHNTIEHIKTEHRRTVV